MRNSHLAFRILLVGTLGVSFSLFSTAAGKSPVAAPMAQSSAADAYGYRWIDNQGSDDPASGGSGPDFTALWQDIATSGTQMSIMADELATTFTCPILIRQYGENWGTAPQGSSAAVVNASIGVSSNCFLRLLPSGGSMTAGPYSNTSLPAGGLSGAGIVAIFWGDMQGVGSSSAQWQVVGTAPERILVVQWNNWGPWGSGPYTSNMQIQIKESDGTGDSEIMFLYQALGTTSATVGIQSRAGSTASQYSGSLAANRAIRFANNANPHVPSNLHQTGTSGGAARPLGFISDATVYFRATVTDPDASNTVGLQAEVLPSTTAFSSNPTGTLVQTDSASLVPVGQVAEALLDFSTSGLPSGDYHWRARTFDNAGAYCAWVVFNAATVHFTTDLVAPSSPGGPFTPDGVQLIYSAPGGNVDFSWGAATDTGPPGPIGYRIQVASSDTFGTLLYDSTVATQSVTVNLPAADLPYYWRVAAVDQAGNNSAPSSTAVFQLGWTTTSAEEEDRYSYCGAGTSPGPWGLVAMLGAVALMAGALIRRRSAV